MGKKILLIEDDTALYALYKTQLEISGYEVSNVSDGGLAYDAVIEQTPDLILLDIILPNKNGIEILEELKAQPETKDIKVVMLTNFGNDENISKALELGAEDYIMKYNIVPSELASKVATVLGESGAATVKIVA